ncbi:MAG: ATP-dependent DNA ligase [Candidatus Nanoarchaeia archaeon]
MDYKTLVLTYSLLEQTSKRLEKTHVISKLLHRTPQGDISMICLLLRGSVFPNISEAKLGVSDKLVIKALMVASGHTSQSINKLWKQTGDLGDVAAKLAGSKKQRTLFSRKLKVNKVFENLRKLPTLTGPGSIDQKVQLVAELLGSASPMESKYIIRTVIGELRVGVAEGTLRDAIVWAFLKPPIKYNEDSQKLDVKDRKEYNELVALTQKAYDIMNDFGAVAEIAKSKGVKGFGKLSLGLGTPLKSMLAQKAEDIEEAFSIVGKPACFEYKYDGFRIQVHKKGKDIALFTRRLENVTKAFPDIVKAVRANVKGTEVILDGEAVGYDPKTKRYLPFQTVSQRIKRKHGVEEMAKKFPVEYVIFDVLMYKGDSMLNEPLEKRREIAKSLTKSQKYVVTLSDQLITSSVKEARAFFKKAIHEGNEGLMAKALDAPYKPGSRVGTWIKIKGSLDPLDLVIVDAEWGEGKRSGWLTSFTLACRDHGKFVEVGKVGTGMKEKEDVGGVSFGTMTKKLKPLITEERGRKVRIKPKIVVEILSEEVQKSPTYSSGYALRFPRVINLRLDKPASEAATLTRIKKQYEAQKKT